MRTLNKIFSYIRGKLTSSEEQHIRGLISTQEHYKDAYDSLIRMSQGKSDEEIENMIKSIEQSKNKSRNDLFRKY